jgi:hypothetical protein
MQDNRVSAVLSEADRQAVLSAIETIRQKLPFLIDLSPEERRTLPKMGDRSRNFVSQALEVATQNEDILPRNFDVEEMHKDVALLASLAPIRLSLTQLQELIEDTYMAIGSEAYTAALIVYQFARASGKGAALDDVVDSLGKRFARKSGTTKPGNATP